MYATGIIAISRRDAKVTSSKLNLFKTNILFRPITTGKIKGNLHLGKGMAKCFSVSVFFKQLSLLPELVTRQPIKKNSHQNGSYQHQQI